jgi:hypothetical protein
MFIIRSKCRGGAGSDWAKIKTPRGLAHLAFAEDADARAYLRATGADTHLESISREQLLEEVEIAGQVLLIPSLDLAEALRRDPLTFPYDRYTMAMSRPS